MEKIEVFLSIISSILSILAFLGIQKLSDAAPKSTRSSQQSSSYDNYSSTNSVNSSNYLWAILAHAVIVGIPAGIYGANNSSSTQQDIIFLSALLAYSFVVGFSKLSKLEIAFYSFLSVIGSGTLYVLFYGNGFNSNTITGMIFFGVIGSVIGVVINMFANS